MDDAHLIPFADAGAIERAIQAALPTIGGAFALVVLVGDHGDGRTAPLYSVSWRERPCAPYDRKVAQGTDAAAVAAAVAAYAESQARNPDATRRDAVRTRLLGVVREALDEGLDVPALVGTAFRVA